MKMAEGSQENVSAQIHNVKLKHLLRFGKLEWRCDRARNARQSRQNALPDHNRNIQSIDQQSCQATSPLNKRL